MVYARKHCQCLLAYAYAKRVIIVLSMPLFSYSVGCLLQKYMPLYSGWPL